MTLGYKNTEAAMHAYTATLKGLKLGQGFFAQLNLLYAKLIIELFKSLIETHSLDRMGEFKQDFELFSEDMVRKYGSTSPYGYAPRSPYEKRKGIKPSFSKSKIYARDEVHESEYSMLL